MKEILTLNKIAKCGTDRFDSAKYICTDNAEDSGGDNGALGFNA